MTSRSRARLGEVIRAAERGDALAERLLSFSRKATRGPARAAIDLDRALAELIAMLDPLLGARIQLRSELGASERYVGLSEGDVEQILLNLAINARDAMPEGGQLTVRTRTVTSSRSAGEQVLLTVSDTGQGMSAKTRERILEPFFTTKPIGEGTGLGLSIVYSLVQQAGGTIEVESERGVGTSFHMRFPVRPAPTGAPGPDPGSQVS